MGAPPDSVASGFRLATLRTASDRVTVTVMRLRTAIAGAAALAALSLPAAASAAPVVSEAPDQSAADVRGYWTADRMRAAEPLAPPAEEAAQASFRGGGATAAAQPPDVESNPALDTTFPQRVHGKLFITFGAQDGSCSATVVRSRTRNVLMTAGHCVVEPGGGGIEPVWATNVAFVPAYRNGATPFGIYPAERLSAPVRWAREPMIELDVGAVNVVHSPAGEIQDVLGARGISFNRPAKKYKRNRTKFTIFGYPGEPSAFYDTERLIICNSPFRGFEKFSGSPVAGPCNQKQGSSGGGWVLGGRVNSVVSHGTCPPATIATCTLTSGTYFGNTAYKLWSNAAGGVPKSVKKKLKKCKRPRKASARAACRAKAQNFKPVVRP